MNDRNRLIGGSAESFEPIALVSDEAVRKDLGVTGEVAAELDRQVQQYSSTFRRLAASRMPRAEAERELAETRLSLATDIERVLSSAQMRRLDQIRWQVQGVNALLDPRMMNRLDLSDEQTKRIESANRSSNDDRAVASAETVRLGDQYPNWKNAAPLAVLSEQQIDLLADTLGSPSPAIRDRDQRKD